MQGDSPWGGWVFERVHIRVFCELTYHKRWNRVSSGNIQDFGVSVNKCLKPLTVAQGFLYVTRLSSSWTIVTRCRRILPLLASL
jgi:hypothetical protein